MTQPLNAAQIDAYIQAQAAEIKKYRTALEEINRWIGIYKVSCGEETTTAIRTLLAQVLPQKCPTEQDF